MTSDERVLIEALPLPGWAPTRAWQLGVGAHGAREGGRFLSTLRLRSALILGLASVPVRFRMHSQLLSSPLNFTYAADAVVSTIAPQSGPVGAPTALTIQGANFNLGLAVACRFEQARFPPPPPSSSSLAFRSRSLAMPRSSSSPPSLALPRPSYSQLPCASPPPHAPSPPLRAGRRRTHA